MTLGGGRQRRSGPRVQAISVEILNHAVLVQAFDTAECRRQVETLRCLHPFGGVFELPEIVALTEGAHLLVIEPDIQRPHASALPCSR